MTARSDERPTDGDGVPDCPAIENRTLVAINRERAARSLTVAIRSEQLTQESSSFLIDTGPELNLLKLGSLKVTVEINKNRIHILVGIGSDLMQPSGQVEYLLDDITCIMSLVPDETTIWYTGNEVP